MTPGCQGHPELGNSGRGRRGCRCAALPCASAAAPCCSSASPASGAHSAHMNRKESTELFPSSNPSYTLVCCSYMRISCRAVNSCRMLQESFMLSAHLPNMTVALHEGEGAGDIASQDLYLADTHEVGIQRSQGLRLLGQAVRAVHVGCLRRECAIHQAAHDGFESATQPLRTDWLPRRTPAKPAQIMVQNLKGHIGRRSLHLQTYDPARLISKQGGSTHDCRRTTECWLHECALH